MVIILWILFGLIGLGLYGLISVKLIELGGGSVYWPWEEKPEVSCIVNSPPVFESVNTASDESRRAVQAGIFTGAVLIRSYRDDQRTIDRLMRGLELARETRITENVKQSEQALEDGRKRRDITFEIYVDQLKQSAEYSMQQNKEQLNDLKKQFRQRKDMKPFERFAELYVRQIEAYKKDHVTDEAKLGGQILELKP
jgi:hypothetical protein